MESAWQESALFKTGKRAMRFRLAGPGRRTLRRRNDLVMLGVSRSLTFRDKMEAGVDPKHDRDRTGRAGAARAAFGGNRS